MSITTGDSVKYLNNLSKEFIKTNTNVALFYLDSFEIGNHPEQSAQHHLKELVSIKKILNEQTLVVVDDSPIIGYLQQSKVKKDTLELIKPGLFLVQQFQEKEV